MALRDGRGARLRRAARGRPGFVALAAALYLVAGVSATWPAVQHLGSHFLAGGAPGYGEAAPGDYLQTGYRLWLVGHQLEHGRAPWRDPYTFRPEAEAAPNFDGWPFGLPFWPLRAAFGPVLSWNFFVLLTYLASGLAACWWLRELGLPRGPSLAGGLAFAIAPYRVMQSGGHLLGPISLLLPLALAAFERARRGGRGWYALSAAALVSIPLSGQVHLALGAIPFFLGYAVCRTRDRLLLAGAGVAVLAAIGVGLLVRQTAIVGSIGAGGRSLNAVGFFSAEALDFLTRHKRHGNESFVFLGWLTPLVAVAGLWLLWQAGRRALAVLLALGAMVPILLSFGTHIPLYSFLWRHFPPFRYPRVPERLMPIACLAIAALVAFALTRFRAAAVAAVAVVALLVDLHVHVYGASAADGGNRAYAALRASPPGRVLEIPVFRPEIHYGSVYYYYDMQARRERPSGYSTLAPKPADAVIRQLERLNCGDWTGGQRELLRRLGVRYLAFHRGLYRQNQFVPDRSWFAWRGLTTNGFTPIAQDGAVTLFATTGYTKVRVPTREPDRRRTVFCQGWYPPTSQRIRTMSTPHAAFWTYGPRDVTVLSTAIEPVVASFAVDGQTASRRRVASVTSVRLHVGRPGWHLITVDVPRLVDYEGHPVGLDVIVVESARPREVTFPSRGTRSRRTASSP